MAKLLVIAILWAAAVPGVTSAATRTSTGKVPADVTLRGACRGSHTSPYYQACSNAYEGCAAVAPKIVRDYYAGRNQRFLTYPDTVARPLASDFARHLGAESGCTAALQAEYDRLYG
jgi:hypothetical protein